LIRASSLALLAALSLGAAADATAPAAAGGVGLLGCLEQEERIGVVALVGPPRRLDLHGWSAEAGVERALGVRDSSGLGEQTIPIVWEELAPTRPTRFADGDRVLLCLQPLPSASIWRERIPDAELRHRVLAVAERGDAFLRRPSLSTLDLLEHFLALAAEDRQGAAGGAYLARLARDGELPLARDAVVHLARVSRIEDALDPSSGGWLVAALLRPDADDALQQEILHLVARRRPEALRSALQAQLAQAMPSALVYAAWAALENGLSAEVCRELLSHGSPEHRVTAARSVSGEEAARVLVPLVRGDPEPAVRAAAVTRLVALGVPEALSAGLTALRDEDSEVRDAAARGLASLGSRSVAGLIDVVERGPREASQAAVLALSEIEPEGLVALQQVATSHPDAGIRMLARMALGQDVREPH